MLIHCRQHSLVCPHLVGGLFVGLRRRMLGPTQRDEGVVALLHPGAGARLVALQAQPKVGGHAHRRMRVGIADWPARSPRRTPARSTPTWPGCGGSRTPARSSSPTRRCRSHIARCAAGCARRPSPSGCGDACATGSRCHARDPSPARRARSSSRCGSARWSPGSGCPAGSGVRRAPSPRTGARRKCPARRSRMAPNTLGESGRGTHIHSTEPADEIRQVFSQSDRNA